MTNTSTFMILLSLCCCYRISSSFSTTGHSFIKKRSSSFNTAGTATTTSQTRSIVQLQSSINIESRSRLYLAIPSSDVNESDLDVSGRNGKEDGENSNNNNMQNNDTPKITSVSNPNETTTNDNGILSQKRNNIEIEGMDMDKNINQNDKRDEITSFSEDGLGAFDPSKKLPLKREVLVGDPQQRVKKEGKSVAEILTELAAIQKQGPQKYCILGSRHVSYLHQQIIELLSYALVLSENHVYTSGAMGTNAAAIRGALRAGRPDLLTVILPQSLSKQTDESQELLRGVTDLIAMPQNDEMNLDVASRLCNSKLLSETDQLVAFAFHESKTVIEATKEAKKLEMLVTTLFLD